MKKWVYIQVEPPQSERFTLLSFSTWFSNRPYIVLQQELQISLFKFEISLNLGVDTSWTVHSDRVTQPAPHAPITILDITSRTCAMKDYYGQTHDSLKNGSRYKLNLPKWSQYDSLPFWVILILHDTTDIKKYNNETYSLKLCIFIHIRIFFRIVV